MGDTPSGLARPENLPAYMWARMGPTERANYLGFSQRGQGLPPGSGTAWDQLVNAMMSKVRPTAANPGPTGPQAPS